MNNLNKQQIFASDIIDFKAEIDSNQTFGIDTLHLFCSPLFIDTMKVLMDKGIYTLSCGSGKERNILPGITCNYDKLSKANKKIAKDLLISDYEFRIGHPIIDGVTTFLEFETALLKIIKQFQKQ
ncbi:MAG: hypothetical protein FWE03_04385 [Firmicutes bacterium]|nr:hypothetical protein [Bacillota bacterium]